MRRVLSTAFDITVSGSAGGICLAAHTLHCSRKTLVNDATYTRGGRFAEAESRAREALLQYNIMVNRGVKPDVLTFTSLIEKMAGANLEWQAYRLFSQMLEMGIEPLPQTYVALRKATKPTRKKLISDITAKIEQTAQSMPNTIAEDVAALVEKGEREEALRHAISVNSQIGRAHV